MSRTYAHQHPFSFISQFGKCLRIVHAGSLLLFTVPLWLVTGAIAPQIAQAYITRVDLALDRLPGESYEAILQRAQTVARAATQRSFDQDILVTDVSVIVTVQNHGAIVPILTLAVTRSDWRQRPDPQLWVTYYKPARSLLFLEPHTTTPGAPQSGALNIDESD
jgi:hypothetical protein